MATKNRRLSVTLLPEWDADLSKLKKERFYDKTYSELIRFLIEAGLKSVKAELNELEGG